MGSRTQSGIVNRQVRFVQRPQGLPTPEVFAAREEALRQVGDGEFLCRVCYLSMDPALMSRMRDEDNYAESVELGETMHAYGVGQVIESKHPRVKKGEVRLGRFDMQEYSIQSDESASTKINIGLAKPSWYLGAVGVTGATAYFSLYDIGQPKRGETILISSGGSSVGSIVAQLARREGCRIVGIVSTDEKAARVKREWGYDEVLSYRGKSEDTLSADIKRACPNGVDIYYDNTGGDISAAVIDHYNDFARIVVIGRAALGHLESTREDIGRRDHNALLTKRIKKQGFVLLDHRARMVVSILKLAKAVRQGDLKVKEDVMHGFEQIPAAFFRMSKGENEGKQIVKLADVDEALDPAPRWLGEALTSGRFPTDKLANLVERLRK